ncbi:MAG: isoprenylcysteine carboxylmethyltransferase family protein [Terriglobales bacterium]
MDRGTIWRAWVPLILGAWAIAVVFAKGPGPHGPARWVGLALAVIGLSGVILGRWTLGRSFSVRAKATALVTTGIYSKIRNPIYVSGEVFLIGAAIMVWRLEFLLALLLIIPVQILRARRESRVLEEKFGEEYREYRRRTWF